MKTFMHTYLAVLVLPLLVLVSNTAVSGVQSEADQEDLFHENESEDYTVPTGKFYLDTLSESDFAAMEIELKENEADLFHEREYEDHSMEW